MRKITKFCLLSAMLFAIPFISVPILSHAERSETYQLLNLFGDVFERVRTDYVEETKDSDLIENALNGMLSSLDPHSSYMNEKGFKEMQVQTKGEFGGLGIEVTMDNGLVKVVSPIDDTPAFKAGIHAGDYITHIDGEPVMGMALSEAVEKMRGPVATSVKISIIREGFTEPKDIPINRAVIKVQSVRSHAEGDIGYIRVTQFTEQTTDALADALAKLKKDIGAMRGLVLDLRNNPGGLLDQAVSVSDAFLEQGEIVSTRERNPNNTKRYTARAGDLAGGVPMVVIINNGSASAAEIVAGALQDQKRAVILGIKSFGKGSVQTVIPLPGHGAMRLTTARYYTPSGRSIQAKGIMPDIVVEQAKIELAKKNDKQQLEADLKGRLMSEDELTKPRGFVKKDPGKTKEDDKNADKKEVKKPDASAEDFQLTRALDLLRALSVYKQIPQTATTGK